VLIRCGALACVVEAAGAAAHLAVQGPDAVIPVGGLLGEAVPLALDGEGVFGEVAEVVLGLGVLRGEVVQFDLGPGEPGDIARRGVGDGVARLGYLGAEPLHLGAGGVQLGARPVVRGLHLPLVLQHRGHGGALDVQVVAESLDDDPDAVGARPRRVGEDVLHVQSGRHVPVDLLSHRCGLRPARRSCGGR